MRYVERVTHIRIKGGGYPNTSLWNMIIFRNGNTIQYRGVDLGFRILKLTKV